MTARDRVCTLQVGFLLGFENESKLEADMRSSMIDDRPGIATNESSGCMSVDLNASHLMDLPRFRGPWLINI